MFFAFEVTIDHGIPKNHSLNEKMNAEDDDEPDGIGQLDFTPILGYNTTISPDDCDVSRDVWVCQD